MFIYKILSRFAIIENSANASTANPGQQEDLVVLTLDSFQSSLFQENDTTSQCFRRKQICNDRPTSTKLDE